MGRQRFSAGQIICKVRETDVESSNGKAARQVGRQFNVKDKT